MSGDVTGLSLYFKPVRLARFPLHNNGSCNPAIKSH